MKFTIKSLAAGTVLAIAATGFATPSLAAADAEAGKATMKQNNCLKCHGMEKDKDAPSFKKISAKWKGKADAESKLATHLTTGPKVKLDDGSEEEHKKIKVKDDAELKNLVQYILEQ